MTCLPPLQSAKHGTVRTRKFAADQRAPQKLGLALDIICIVSYYLKQIGAPEIIRCARHAPLIIYLACTRSHRVLPCSADWPPLPSTEAGKESVRYQRCYLVIIRSHLQLLDCWISEFDTKFCNVTFHLLFCHKI